MAFDDLVLRLQSFVDRVSRWARLPRPAEEAGCPRRFLIVQIDGLSRSVLERALATGRMRGLARLLSARRLEMRPLSVGIPSSTPAFQAALMYGVHPDIPGFHWYDKRERAERYFPRPGVADLVEERLARGRRGIMEGGACYGCIFTGGATDSLWTFARLLRPGRAGPALLRMPLSAVLLAWVVLKCCVLTVTELTRAVLGRVADPLGPGRLKGLWFKLGLSVWMRQLFTLAASADLYRGVPAVYVNYLDYDVFAHGFGPEHRLALRALRRVDRSIMQLHRVARRLPECRYDVYVLSDHGQVRARPFRRVSRGASIEQTVVDVLGRRPAAYPGTHGSGKDGLIRLKSQLADYRRVRSRGVFQRFLTYLERDRPWLREAGLPDASDTIRVVAAGPNAFVYFTEAPEPLPVEEIEARYPGGAAALSEHPGIGFVLARSAAGPVCWSRGRRTVLDQDARGTPFEGRADRDVVLMGLRQLMAMPSAGDLVLYGIGATAGDVSFVDEIGAHAGPAEAELQTFILHPPAVALPAGPLTHPIQLYPHFAAYAGPVRDPVGAARRLESAPAIAGAP